MPSLQHIYKQSEHELCLNLLSANSLPMQIWSEEVTVKSSLEHHLTREKFQKGELQYPITCSLQWLCSVNTVGDFASQCPLVAIHSVTAILLYFPPQY